MTRMKMLGLLTAVVLTAMTFVGGSSASADMLCSTNSEPCSGTEYLSGSAITAKQSGTAELDGTFPVKCSGGSAAAEVTESGGEEVEGKITALTFTGCKIFGLLSCTVTTTLSAGGSYNVGINAEEPAGTGRFKVTTSTKKPGAVFNCGSAGSCKFGESSIDLMVNGSATQATLVAEGGTKSDLVLEEGSASSCGSTAQLTATYNLTPAALFVKPALATLELTTETGAAFTLGQEKGFVIDNSGNATMWVKADLLTSADFEFVGANCNGNIAPGASCTRKIKCRASPAAAEWQVETGQAVKGVKLTC